MNTIKSLIITLMITIVALLSLGFAYPNGSLVYDNHALLTSFYILVASGLAAIGLVDLKNKWIDAR